jgi:hypothetical protein
MGYWVKIVTREEKPPNWPNILYMNSGKGFWMWQIIPPSISMVLFCISHFYDISIYAFVFL